jgi:hypothetical protein
MSENTGELLVGVTQSPDGTPDDSKALYMSSNELKISDPIVDRLKGSLIIDEDREKRYQSFQAGMLKKLGAGELNSWLLNTLNGVKKKDSSEITLSDISTLRFVTDAPEVKELQTQYGYEFARPHFQLSLGDFKRVYEKLTGRLDSNGCLLSGGKLEADSLTEKIGLTLAPSLNPDIAHELRHTIDPNLGKRSPSDEVLEEVAAYYQETYAPKIYTQTVRTQGADGKMSEPETTTREVYNNLRLIRATLKGELYSDKYASSFKSAEMYKERVDQIVDIVGQLEQYMNKRDVNKAIYNAKSYFELTHLLETEKRNHNLGRLA